MNPAWKVAFTESRKTISFTVAVRFCITNSRRIQVAWSQACRLVRLARRPALVRGFDGLEGKVDPRHSLQRAILADLAGSDQFCPRNVDLRHLRFLREALQEIRASLGQAVALLAAARLVGHGQFDQAMSNTCRGQITVEDKRCPWEAIYRTRSVCKMYMAT